MKEKIIKGKILTIKYNQDKKKWLVLFKSNKDKLYMFYTTFKIVPMKGFDGELIINNRVAGKQLDVREGYEQAPFFLFDGFKFKYSEPENKLFDMLE